MPYSYVFLFTLFHSSSMIQLTLIECPHTSAFSAFTSKIAPPPPPPFPSLSPSSLPTPLPSSLRLPFLLILSSLLSLSGLISYNSTSLGAGRGLGVIVGLGNGLVGAWGWWVGVFGRGSYRSRKTVSLVSVVCLDGMRKWDSSI